MANSVMNYTQFMSACKSAVAKYGAKGDIKQQKEGSDKSKTNQDLATLGGKGTASLERYTKEYLAKVKSTKVVSKK